MKKIHIKEFHRRDILKNAIIFMAFVIGFYLLATLYFTKHYFFHTSINGVNVSLKSHQGAEAVLKQRLEAYSLTLIENSGESELIRGSEIGLQYHDDIGITELIQVQKPYRWFGSLFKGKELYLSRLYTYDNEKLESRLKKLNALNRETTESRNVSFRYINSSFEAVKEVYGNRLHMDKLRNTIRISIAKGIRTIDLQEAHCYEEPIYTLKSEKTNQTRELLNRYAASLITYQFGTKQEIVDGKLISKWLKVDKNLDVTISNTAVMLYMKGLSNKYDTVGTTRSFQTSTGKTVEVTGGLYGWKIDQEKEIAALTENIKAGTSVVREPVYSQTALSRDNELGNTYVEINITRQYLWFYKNGRLIAQGSVVTGNPNRGLATVVGVYMINYKQKEATLAGPGYAAKVTYWMPFFGNMGIHDARWRSSFGGEIYKSRGTHGCVNAPYSLAKKIFENIEEGTPVISYEEE